MAKAFQTAGFAFQGTGQFAFQETIASIVAGIKAFIYRMGAPGHPHMGEP